MNHSNTSQSSIFKVFASGEPTTKRYVVFLDIMGFKERVARYDHVEILSDLQQLSNFISENLQREEGFLFTMFSDSIIILSSDVEYSTFVKLIRLTNAIIERSISLNLPIKGAMACGECTAMLGDKALYFGQPIIDAYILEESAELYNVVLHHTVEENAIRLSDETKEIFDYQVKLKGGISKHYILAWFASSLEHNKNNLIAIRKTVSDYPRRYIDNTLNCISEYEKQNN